MRYWIDMVEQRVDEITRPASQDEVYRILTKAGYDFLGQGSFGSVFEKPGANYVLKVFAANDDAYLAFIELARAHPDNPHFPKFTGKIVRVNDRFRAIRMEKLRPADSTVVDYVDTYMNDWQHVPSYDDAMQFLDWNPKLKEACDLIMQLGYELDVNGSNCMGRADGTFVFTDPVAYFGS